MAASVQFKGLECVVKAFENRGVDTFSIFQAKQFMFKGDGVDELSEILKSLENSGTSAVYTLKIYEKTLSDKVKNNTSDDGSFNFKLNENDSERYGVPAKSHPGSNGSYLLSRLDELENKIGAALAKDEEEEDEEEEKELSQMEKILIPIMPVLIEKVMMFFSQNPGGQQMNGISESVAKLSNRVPDLNDKIEKLSKMADENPELFENLMSAI